RPFNLDWKPKFFANPCELAPVMEATAEVPERNAEKKSKVQSPKSEITDSVGANAPQQSPLDSLRRLVAERAELPVSAVTAESRLLADLHLNSISVGQLVAEAARQLQ